MVKELIFFCALVIRIAHQVDLRAFDRPVNQRVHAADGTQDAVELAAGHPEADEIDLLEFDPALLEPALGLFCVKAFFLSEDLDVHFIPPVTADDWIGGYSSMAAASASVSAENRNWPAAV